MDRLTGPLPPLVQNGVNSSPSSLCCNEFTMRCMGLLGPDRSGTVGVQSLEVLMTPGVAPSHTVCPARGQPFPQVCSSSIARNPSHFECISALCSWGCMSSVLPYFLIPVIVSGGGEGERLSSPSCSTSMAVHIPFSLLGPIFPSTSNTVGFPGLRPHRLGERESPSCSPGSTVPHQLGHCCPPSFHPSQVVH